MSMAGSGEHPKYRALGKLCLEPGWRTIEDGAEFEYSGAPTNGMQPLNAPARAAKLRLIDKHWRETRPQQINRLAKSLGFVGADSAAACSFIEAFIETETLKEPTP